ncbi:DUF1661 domain-containing protein [Porphyromonas gingivalis]|nr:DUF1661 domain-containing protein [Porphyromonas gingivalis]ERJ85534.1 hypothetical protein HMPREF1989_01623 [Porphyromonas gingivalis F0566]USI93585.1 DUF1661 domain-containing protein [Porphyromonas gingivalis]USI95473.1 DUF1661 domain-containing protein [Porphyromonas gingivalis]USI97378.1 DUF1661 domain-containing protein [Porphyromonas gingivalis]
MRVCRTKWREIFFVLARNFFTSHAKTKKFSHHVLWRYKQENFGA